MLCLTGYIVQLMVAIIVHNIISSTTIFKPGPATPKDNNVGHRILKPKAEEANWIIMCMVVAM
jgi:hypothetical protein